MSLKDILCFLSMSIIHERVQVFFSLLPQTFIALGILAYLISNQFRNVRDCINCGTIRGDFISMHYFRDVYLNNKHNKK